MAATYQAVGQRARRIDSPPKLTGTEQFTGDLRIPGMLRARIIGSDYAHARIVSVDKSAALEVPGVAAVLTADDLPVKVDDHGQPVAQLLAGNEALHVGHPIALVLAETDEAAADAAELVVVEYESLPVVTVLQDSIRPDAPLVSEGRSGAMDDEAAMHNADAASAGGDATALPHNVSNSINFERGDVEAGFAEADEVVEFDFTSLTVHQGYIEPQVALAIPGRSGKLTIHSSTQGAFHGRNKVSNTLGIPPEQVNIVQMPVGGGFGGKFVLIEPLVAAAAVAVNRPVLLQYSRTDDFLAGNPAPECQIRVRVGATRNGRLTALEAHLLFDAGSASGSPLGIGAILLGGNYKVPNLKLTGFETQTHKPSAGAYRAPGAQQAAFAIESALDELIRKLDLDPVEFRLKNCAEEGDLRPTGSPWPKIGARDTLEALKQHPKWQNREESRAAGKGIGVALASWPGGVEPATAACRLDSDGKLTVVLGSVDLNGTNTTFAQIAAEELGTSLDGVRIATGDTDSAPFAGGTGGSKITYTVGPAVRNAVSDAVEQIKNIAAQKLEVAPDDLEMHDGTVRVKGVPGTSISLKEIAELSMSMSTGNQPVYGRGGSGITQSAPAFAAHLAEVEVDELTGEVHVTGYVAVQDVGFALNPALVEGQIHGGVAQGIGWALYEGIGYDADGQPDAASLMDYTLPRSTMIPDIDVVLVQVASELGPYGAKGVGEPPAIPGAAAVANAIRDAVGARMLNLPMRQHDVLASIPEA
ncbi:MAG TPA: xanthine dehydrogenase family protein molybdopterin-binding subunit [Thermomicrobiales bacterium]|nr:xanthine dehydrogenase family protein molybdopterin-binding subunit [Thermomicrobiales bacterium]